MGMSEACEVPLIPVNGQRDPGDSGDQSGHRDRWAVCRQEQGQLSCRRVSGEAGPGWPHDLHRCHQWSCRWRSADWRHGESQLSPWCVAWGWPQHSSSHCNSSARPLVPRVPEDIGTQHDSSSRHSPLSSRPLSLPFPQHLRHRHRRGPDVHVIQSRLRPREQDLVTDPRHL